MTRKKTSVEKSTPQTLRERAEALVSAKSLQVQTLQTSDVEALVHELNVHQVELKIQNEELREAQMELIQSRDRYSELYDFAPVGYITLDTDGRILEANLTAVTMLGNERDKLLGANLSKFIANHSQDDFYLHRQSVHSAASKQVCELDMHKADGTPLTIRLESIARADDEGWQCHTVLINVTELRQAVEQVQEGEEHLRLAAAVTGFDTYGFGTYDFDKRSGRLVWSKQLLAIFGLPETTKPSEELFMALLGI
jgi:PAS domain S-box-containing protein